MNLHKTLVIFLFLQCFQPPSFAQMVTKQETRNYPENYFQSPLSFPLLLAGTFGEIRPNHFHSGMDIKTEGEIGKPVMAAANGYVSRIKVQANGFGYALYMTHPNGYVTVYGHLSRYNDIINQYIRAKQYDAQRFEIDVTLKPSEITVKKGDIIAYSGNTGSSGGPHLHFEIRDSRTEAIINPLLFGLQIKDTQAPKITRIGVYPMGANSQVNGDNKALKLPLRKHNGICRCEKPLKLTGTFGFAIETNDAQEGTDGNNGIYSIELQIDEQIIYKQQMERFLFDETRYVNAHIDYEEKQRSGSTIQRSYTLPGNKIPIYTILVNNGIYTFNDEKEHQLKYTVKDASGNTSIALVSLKATTVKLLKNVNHEKYAKLIHWSDSCTASIGNCAIAIPKAALYENLKLQLSESCAPTNCYAPIYNIQNKYTPLQKGITIKIKPDKYPSKLRRKLLLVNMPDTGTPIAVGGALEKDYIVAKTKTFGSFTVMADTIPPAIEPLNIKEERNMSREADITFRISDNLSGINTYNLYIDGKWVLAALDAKTGTLSYTFDSRCSAGTHHLKLVVTDERDNIRLFECNFKR